MTFQYVRFFVTYSGLLDQSPVLHRDWHASFYLQPHSLVATNHCDSFQRGHDGAGVGGCG